jgi:queuine tRNA-ribosyltransferase
LNIDSGRILDFVIEHKDRDSAARAGLLRTQRGLIPTPIFMPVGTAATVKGLHRHFLLNDLDAPIVLANTYHLYLRPGTQVLEGAGGIHRFMNWDRPVLTDSGGYQVYSLGAMRKLTEEGVKFRSHIDGSSHLFTPERVVDIQRSIGAEFMMAFDECTPYPCEHSYAKRSLGLTHRWLDRCMLRYRETAPLYNNEQALIPIVQGSVYPDLRKESATRVLEHEAPLYAIGGLSVGEPAEDMYAMTADVCAILPQEKPRYLMGVGTPANILESIALGIDMFDCVMPTRNGRNGTLFSTEGVIAARNKKWENDHSPIDPLLTPEYSKAYLRHLFVAGEMLGPIIASLQNLRLYLWLVREARKQILEGNFASWKSEMLVKLMQKM